MRDRTEAGSNAYSIRIAQAPSPWPLERELEIYVRDIRPTLIDQLGVDLYEACRQDDVAQVQALASPAKRAKPQDSVHAICAAIDKWAKVLVAAVYQGATSVACHCMEHPDSMGLIDTVLRFVIFTDGADTVYRFLVESGYVDVNFHLDRTGTVLGFVAGTRGPGKHNLVEYILTKGGDPNQTVECQGHRKVLACAAGYNDLDMVKLLLNYGAKLKGSGALVLAAQEGRVGIVKYLLAQRADVNEMGIATYDKRSWKNIGTPLHKAVWRKQFLVIDLLLAAGADRTLRDAEGRTGADIAVENGLDEQVLTKLKLLSKR